MQEWSVERQVVWGHEGAERANREKRRRRNNTFFYQECSLADDIEKREDSLHAS